MIGREFSLNLLERVSGHDRTRLLALLDEDAAVLVQAAEGVARLRFRDEQARQDLYRQLSATQRATLHRLVGEALEQLHGDDLDPHLAALAHHFCAAAADGDARKAIHYSLLAGRAAHASFDHAAAAQHYHDAVDALDSTSQGSAAQRFNAQLGLAEAHGEAGMRDQSRAAAERALALARKLAQPESVARCVLAYAGRPQPFRLVACDERVVALLEEALAGLDDADSPVRARVLGRLAEELTFSERHERMRSVAHQALAIARRQPDRAVLAYVLRATHWALWGPSNPSVRAALAHEILAHIAASAERAPGLELDAHLFRLWALIEQGDVPAARTELSGCARLAEQLGQSYSRWLVATTRVCLAFMTSALESVPALAEEAYRLGDASDNPNAALFYGIQITYLQWLRGDLSEAESTLRAIGDDHPLLTLAVRAALADTHAELGHRDEARSEFEAIAARGFRTLPRNLTWITSMSFLAETCARLGDVDRAAEIYVLLEPLAKCNLMLVPVASFGATSYYLGLLATTLRRWTDAERHFEDAIRKQVWMGTRHMIARAECEHAAMLLERGRGDDRARALEKLGRARTIAQEFGMRAVLGRIAALEKERTFAAGAGADDRAAPRTAGGSDAGDSSGQASVPDAAVDSSARAVLSRTGDLVKVEFAGQTAHYSDDKGFRHIGLLLRHPGLDIHVFEMVRICEGADPDQIAAPSLRTSAMELEDAPAVRAYLQDLDRLRAELDQAEAAESDLGRRDQLQSEIDKLEAHLREAVSPSGKHRRAKSPEDLARQTVQKALRNAIKKIRLDFPELAEHLKASIKTGYSCSYAARGGHRIDWLVLLAYRPRKPRV